jgi:predicted dehydrogenase
MGVIGCGWAGGQHARAMRALADRVELCAIADVDAARAADRAAAWQVPLWSDDWRSLLERTPLDAVSVCLPHRLHAPVAIAAAQAGRHVLVEKPLAPTLAEADAMIAAADRARVRLMVAENARFDATFLRVAALVHAGALGEVFLVRISREHEMHAYLRERPWFLEDPSAGIIYSGGIHDFELLRMLAGEPEHVYGLAGRKVLPEMVGDDSGVAASGSTASGSACSRRDRRPASRRPRRSWCRRGTRSAPSWSTSSTASRPIASR